MSETTPRPYPSDVLTIEEAAELLRLSVRTLSRMVRGADAPPHRRCGRVVRFERAALLRWLSPGQRSDRPPDATEPARAPAAAPPLRRSLLERPPRLDARARKLRDELLAKS